MLLYRSHLRSFEFNNHQNRSNKGILNLFVPQDELFVPQVELRFKRM